MRVANPVVATLLRSPLHRLLSGQVLLLTYTGRRSGRRHTLPVMYAREGTGLVILPGHAHQKRWWRNFEVGHPASVLLQGSRYQGTGHVIGEPLADDPRLLAYLRRFPKTPKPDRLVVIDLDDGVGGGSGRA